MNVSLPQQLVDGLYFFFISRYFMVPLKHIAIIPAGLNYYFETKESYGNLLNIDDDFFFICGHNSAVSQCEQRLFKCKIIAKAFILYFL